MTTDEKEIIDYLKGWPKTFVSGKEIARKVGGKERYEEDRGWALPILAQLVRQGVLEADFYGYYKLKLEDEKKKRNQRHVAPQLLRILKSSGKSFEGISLDDLTNEPPAYRKPSAPAPGNGDKRS